MRSSPFVDSCPLSALDATPPGQERRGYSAEPYTFSSPDVTTGDSVGRWPEARIVRDPGALAEHVDGILDGSGHVGLHNLGAPFQIKVWEALLNLRSGHGTTNSCIASHIGNPRGARAVGTAVGIIP